VSRIVWGHDAQVAAWVAKQLDESDFGNCRAAAIVAEGNLVGGIVFNSYRPLRHGNDMHLVIATISPKWCSRGVLREIFDYVFNRAGCVRATAITARGNKKARKMLEGLGFKLEGTHPRAFDGRQAAVSYGMMKEHCRWLGDVKHG